MSTFSFDPNEQEAELSTFYAPEVELSGFISLPAAVLPDVHPDYAAVRHHGGLDERAVMALWLRRTEVVLFLLSQLDNTPSNLEIIRSKFDEMLTKVFPSCAPRLDPESVRSCFEDALGLHSGTNPHASFMEVPAGVNADRRGLHLAFQRPWSFVESRCLRLIAPLAERLNDASTFEKILIDPAHPRFELVLGITRDIAENTSPLLEPRPLERKRVEQSEMRRRLVGHLTHALLICDEPTRADKIVPALEAFDSEALAAIEYLLDSPELPPRLNRALLNTQARVIGRSLQATPHVSEDFSIQGYDPKLFAI
jgi:hypothetical protein